MGNYKLPRVYRSLIRPPPPQGGGPTELDLHHLFRGCEFHQQPLDNNKVTCFEHQFEKDHRLHWSKLITVSNINCLSKKKISYL